jgi:hypothetical protein
MTGGRRPRGALGRFFSFLARPPLRLAFNAVAFIVPGRLSGAFNSAARRPLRRAFNSVARVFGLRSVSDAVVPMDCRGRQAAPANSDIAADGAATKTSLVRRSRFPEH